MAILSTLLSAWDLLARITRHRWLDESDARRALGDGGVERLQSLVVASELLHSGEIRVCVEAGLPLSYLWRGASPRERAVTMFGKLRVWDTEHNNGVLIYLLLAERRIEIVADRGLNAHVSAGQWQALAASMAGAFQSGRFSDGLASAIGEVHELLSRHFKVPPGSVNANELPDAVVLR
jgi:uncharacterized membrane protein